MYEYKVLTKTLLSFIYEYLANYKLGLERGILKVLSKMGISTVASYTGSQIFEIVGKNLRSN